MDIKKIRWLARILFYGPWFIVQLLGKSHPKVARARPHL